MRKYFAVFLTSLLVNTIMLHAQFKDFNLSDYKLPLIDRNAMELNLSLTGSNTLNKNNAEDLSSDKESTFNFSNNSFLGFGHYKNSERLQSEQDFRLNLSPNYYKNVADDSITDKEFRMGSTFSVLSTHRIYFKKQFFFEPDLNVLASRSHYNTDIESDGINSKRTFISLGVKIPLLIGKGRIEQVQDARLALYVLEELQKTGRLARVPSKEEVLEFAALISKIHNLRYFDYRLHKMYEIEQVDSFLQSKALATQPDARYFTTVNDNWDYAFGPVRESGRRISLGIIPNFEYNRNDYNLRNLNDTIDRDDRNSSAGLILVLNYRSARPINLYWQSDLAFEISYNLAKGRHKEIPENYTHDTKENEFAVNAGYSLGFYPNTRTNLKTGIDAEVFRRLEKLEHEFYEPEVEQINLGSTFYINWNYYISPQVRLAAQYSFRALYRDSDSGFYGNDNFSQNFDIQFRYMIF